MQPSSSAAVPPVRRHGMRTRQNLQAARRNASSSSVFDYNSRAAFSPSSSSFSSSSSASGSASASLCQRSRRPRERFSDEDSEGADAREEDDDDDVVQAASVASAGASPTRRGPLRVNPALEVVQSPRDLLGTSEEVLQREGRAHALSERPLSPRRRLRPLDVAASPRTPASSASAGAQALRLAASPEAVARQLRAQGVLVALEPGAAPLETLYADLERLSQGAFGVVYRARRRADGRLVAVKVMRPLKAGGRVDLARGVQLIEREIFVMHYLQTRCRAAASKRRAHEDDHDDDGDDDHDDDERTDESAPAAGAGRAARGRGFVQLYRAYHTADGAEFYLEMQYVEGGTGETLAQQLQPALQGRSAAARAEAEARFLDAALWLMERLRFMHEHDVLHRDIKPENLLWNAAARTLLYADFGTACFMNADGEGCSSSDRGTPKKLDPSLARGVPATAWSDVYALGITLYEMLFNTRYIEKGAQPENRSGLLPLYFAALDRIDQYAARHRLQAQEPFYQLLQLLKRMMEPFDVDSRPALDSALELVSRARELRAAQQHQ